MFSTLHCFTVTQYKCASVQLSVRETLYTRDEKDQDKGAKLSTRRFIPLINGKNQSRSDPHPILFFGLLTFTSPLLFRMLLFAGLCPNSLTCLSSDAIDGQSTHRTARHLSDRGSRVPCQVCSVTLAKH